MFVVLSYGPPGLGKSTLMDAAADWWRLHGCSASVMPRTVSMAQDGYKTRKAFDQALARTLRAPGLDALFLHRCHFDARDRDSVCATIRAHGPEGTLVMVLQAQDPPACLLLAALQGVLGRGEDPHPTLQRLSMGARLGVCASMWCGLQALTPEEAVANHLVAIPYRHTTGVPAHLVPDEAQLAGLREVFGAGPRDRRVDPVRVGPLVFDDALIEKLRGVPDIRVPLPELVAAVMHEVCAVLRRPAPAA